MRKTPDSISKKRQELGRKMRELQGKTDLTAEQEAFITKEVFDLRVQMKSLRGLGRHNWGFIPWNA
jgi:hypothetical protein